MKKNILIGISVFLFLATLIGIAAAVSPKEEENPTLYVHAPIIRGGDGVVSASREIRVNYGHEAVKYGVSVNGFTITDNWHIENNSDEPVTVEMAVTRETGAEKEVLISHAAAEWELENWSWEMSGPWYTLSTKVKFEKAREHFNLEYWGEDKENHAATSFTIQPHSSEYIQLKYRCKKLYNTVKFVDGNTNLPLSEDITFGVYFRSNGIIYDEIGENNLGIPEGANNAVFKLKSLEDGYFKFAENPGEIPRTGTGEIIE